MVAIKDTKRKIKVKFGRIKRTHYLVAESRRQELLLWCSGLMVWLVSVEALAGSLAQHSGLRICCCCSCGIGNFHMLQG